MLLTTSFLQILSKACNHYLALDPASKKRLTRLEGKVITIQLKPLAFIFQCHIADGKMMITNHQSQTPDAVIIGTPLQLLGVTLNKSQRHRFFADDVVINGDTLVAEQLIKLFDELDIDWEEQSASIIGDIPTHHISKWLKKGKRWLNESTDSFMQNTRDYLQEERMWLPTREALQDFYQEIDEITLDTDRLLARVTLLKQKIE